MTTNARNADAAQLAPDVEQTILQEPTDAALLARLDAILLEVQKLRTTLQTRHTGPKRIDYVAQLSGALGPAAPDELDFFRANDLDWERFAS